MLIVHHCKNEQAALDALTQALLFAMQRKKGAFSLALSGGGTAQKMFKHWVRHWRADIAWERLRFYWVDERCVPPDDEQSNFFHAKQLLLDPLGIPEEDIHRMRGEGDPQKEARRYGMSLKQTLPMANGLPRLDCAILGIGDDGHTASIFPNTPALLKKRAPCAVSAHPQSGQKRITLTGPTLLNAKHLFVALIGREKKPIFKKLFHDGEVDVTLPSGYLLDKARWPALFTDFGD